MSAAPRCHVLYALLIGGLVSATGYAAAIAQPSGQGVQASDSNQKRDAALGAANARRNPAAWGGPLQTGDTASAPAGPRAPAARDRQQSPVMHDGPFVAPHRDLPRRLDVEPGARGFGATRSGAAGRPSSTVLSAASRSVAGIKPLAAGNGAIGGPRIAARGVIGGAVNGKSVIKSSIDGNALRRRF